MINTLVNSNKVLLNNPKFIPHPASIFKNLDIAENTRKEYQARIPIFLAFIKRNGFNHNSYLSFKQLLRDRTDLSVSTKNKYLISAKVFLKELHRRGYLPVDTTQNIKGFTQNKLHKKDGLFDTEINRLMEYCRHLEVTPRNSRLKAILALLTFQGLRQVEIIRLDVADINIKAGTAFIMGKGLHDKEPVYLHPQMVKVLKQYMHLNKLKDGPLFKSESNNSRTYRGFLSK